MLRLALAVVVGTSIGLPVAGGDDEPLIGAFVVVLSELGEVGDFVVLVVAFVVEVIIPIGFPVAVVGEELCIGAFVVVLTVLGAVVGIGFLVVVDVVVRAVVVPSETGFFVVLGTPMVTGNEVVGFEYVVVVTGTFEPPPLIVDAAEPVEVIHFGVVLSRG